MPTNPTPTTQAVEQLREKIAEKMVEVDEAAHWEECQEEYCDYYSSPKDFYDKANQIISALADTIKIVFDNREDYIKLCRSVGLGSSSEDSAFNQGLSAGLHLQRQRLELVVEEMKLTPEQK